jgi:hypothetical protein
VIPAADFYAPDAGPLKQGDVLLAGVARLVADDRFTPPAWRRLDAFDVTIAGARHDGGDLSLASGPALVMVTSHDCHFDRDWNRRRTGLIKAGASEEEAERAVDGDESLDRTFTASPLIDPDELVLDRGNLMSGKMVGYLPVPSRDDGLVPDSIVDLTYRVTLDRLDVVRVACVSNVARAQLRYAMARLDSLRATTLGFEIEAVVGRHIEKVTISTANPLLVRLQLEGGDTIELLQQPAEPVPGAARPGPPRR